MSLEKFLANFYKEYNDVTEEVNKLSKTDDNQELKTKLATDYESISNRTEILQKYFTDNTPFIPNFEIRKAQEHLSKLKKLSQDKRDEIFPKKKFGFKSKQNITTLENTIQTTASNIVEKELLGNQLDVILDSDNSCSIRDIDGVDLIKLENEINGKDIGIVNVKNSCIQLMGNPSVVHATNIENSTILCGPVSGSGFFNNLKNVKLVIGCHQLRIHESFNAQFYVHLGSRAIIENCTNVQFSQYSWSYPSLAEHFIKSGLDPNQSNWTCIDDFNFLKQNQQSPNWSFLNEADRLKWISNDKNELKIESNIS